MSDRFVDLRTDAEKTLDVLLGKDKPWLVRAATVGFAAAGGAVAAAPVLATAAAATAAATAVSVVWDWLFD